MADLWNGAKLPVIEIVGRLKCGKSTFVILCDPKWYDFSTPPSVLIYDFEGSCDPYVGLLKFDRKDVRQAVADGIHRQTMAPEANDPEWLRILKTTADVNDNPNAAMFRAACLSLLQQERGRYAVGAFDTAKPFEDGCTEWLKRHPAAFGRTANQYDKMAAVYLFPDKFSILSHIVATEARARFETFCVTFHLKHETVKTGDSSFRRTGQMIPEGAEVWGKLASLILELEKIPKAKDKDAPDKPSAIVHGSRLVKVVNGQLKEVLPPRLPEATPDAIRAYIAEPVDRHNLKPGERMQERVMTAEERLQIEAAKAENERATAEAHLSALELAWKAVSQGALAVGPVAVAVAAESPRVEPSPGPAAATQTDSLGKDLIQIHEPPPSQPGITEQQAREMISIMKEIFSGGAEASAWLKTNHAVENPGQLTSAAADGVMSQLFAMKAARQAAANPTPAVSTPEQGGMGMPAATNGRCTTGQRDRIRELTVEMYGNTAGDEQKSWLKSMGLSVASSLTADQAASRIGYLMAKMHRPTASVVDSDIPF